MGEIVILDNRKRAKDERGSELWEAYRIATVKAQASLDIEDGIRAGKAWSAWLDHFRAVMA